MGEGGRLMKPLMDEDSSLPDRGMLGGRGLIYKDLKGTEREGDL